MWLIGFLSMFRHGSVLKLKDNLLVNVVFLLLAILLLDGWPVPSGTEMVDLLAAFKQWHPDFLLNDWTFSQPHPEHRLFELGVGFLTLSLERPIPIRSCLTPEATRSIRSSQSRLVNDEGGDGHRVIL